MAVIKYNTPDGTVEYQVAAADIKYQKHTDHWRVKAGTEDGRDVFELIPRERVFSVKIAGVQTGKQLTQTI